MIIFISLLCVISLCGAWPLFYGHSARIHKFLAHSKDLVRWTIYDTLSQYIFHALSCRVSLDALAVSTLAFVWVLNDVLSLEIYILWLLGRFWSLDIILFNFDLTRWPLLLFDLFLRDI